MPYLVTLKPQEAMAADTTLSESIARAGSVIGKGIDEARKAQREAQEHDRKLQIEEMRAKAALIKAQGVDAEKQLFKQQTANDRAATVNEYAGEVGKARQVEAYSALKGAINGPQGALGPFGMFSGAASKVAEMTAAVNARMAGHIQVASQMTKAGAKDYLTKKGAEEKQFVLSQGYEDEFKSLDTGLAEGAFEPYFDPKRKNGEPSEAAVQMHDDLQKDLQEKLAAHKPPGEVHDRIVKLYYAAAAARARGKAWEEADPKAQEMILGIRKLVDMAPDTIDPITGKSMKHDLNVRLANATTEWERTLPGEPGAYMKDGYRAKNDAGQSLAQLQRILFGAEIEANAEQFLAEDDARRQAAFSAKMGGGAQAEAAMVGRGPFGTPRPPGGTSSQAAQVAPGARQAGKAPAAQPKAAQPSQGQRGQLEETVLQEAQKAFQSGQGDPTKTVAKLRETIATRLGLKPTDPKVHAAVKEALQKMFGAQKR